IIEYEAKDILNKGRDEGRAEGRDEGKTEIILEMLKENQPLDFIARISKYSKEKITEIGRMHGVL
ncbi:MAG: transposase, partial [Selenomonas sp.]|nr:transposase [Selenomonas sp.]